MQFCKILLADDDPDDVSILKDAVKDIYPHNLIAAVENGHAALELLNAQYEAGHIPNLIVLDLNMPRMNGSDTLRIIKSDDRFKEIPVIIFSTSINPAEKDRCLKLGAHSYMIKPSSMQESVDTARTFLEFCNLAHFIDKD